MARLDGALFGADRRLARQTSIMRHVDASDKRHVNMWSSLAIESWKTRVQKLFLQSKIDFRFDLGHSQSEAVFVLAMFASVENCIAVENEAVAFVCHRPGAMGRL